MSQFRFLPDAQYPNAVTVITPSGQRLRLTEHPDGRLRLRATRMGPALIQEFYGTGDSEDVIISIVPEGWARKEHGTFPKEIADTITNARRLESIADAVMADVTGLIYQLGRLVNGPAESDVPDFFTLTVKYLVDLGANLEASGFLGGMKHSIKTHGYEIRKLGQMTRVQGSIAYAIGLWSGKNHVKRNVLELFDEAKALLERAANKDDAGKEKLSIHDKTKIGQLEGYKNSFQHARGLILTAQADALEVHEIITRADRL